MMGENLRVLLLQAMHNPAHFPQRWLQMHRASLPKILAVVGPTGSGKSQLALDLAQALGGEILCTDSMQVYQKLDIGTAKPSLADQRCVPHHQLDLVPPDGYYSAGQYEKDAERIMVQLNQQKKTIILVGGSGLYFRTTLFGMCQTPEIPQEIKNQVTHWHEQGLALCYQKLQQCDPLCAATLHPHDTTRILRALEVFLATGRSIQSYQQAHGFKTQKYAVLAVGCWHERGALYQRINERTHAMLKEGWIEEVESLLKAFPPTLKSLQAIGYRQVVQFLTQRLTYREMVEQIQQKTRNYAKRQLTWFRKDPEIQWFLPHDHSKILSQAAQFFENE